MMRTLTVTVALSAAFVEQSKATCPNMNLSKCGNASVPECCSDGNYCMPWTPNYYQCVSLPSQCSRQFTDYDFYGGDIKAVYGLQPGDCCTTCLSTSGCLAYSYMSEYQGTTACYLKAGMGKPNKVSGVVSAVIDSYTNDQDQTPKQGAEALELLSA